MRFRCGCEQHVKGMRTDHSSLRERTVWKLCERHSSLMERVVDQ